jgi:DNA-binding NarL/FixJ family response regulator
MNCGPKKLVKTMVRITIIDDDTETRLSIAQKLSKAQGFTCVADYEDCESAIKNLYRDKPDIVLMDLKIPGHMNGEKGTAIIKEKMPQVEVVILTNIAEDDHLFESFRCGASGYLLKNADKDTIVKRLKEFVDEGTTMSMGVARKVIEYFRTRQPAEPLTSREQEVLAHLLQGKANDEIAAKLHVEVSTIKFHNKNIFRKMHVSNRIELMFRGNSAMTH